MQAPHRGPLVDMFRNEPPLVEMRVSASRNFLSGAGKGTTVQEDGYNFKTQTFPSLSTLTNSLDSLWKAMSINQITTQRPTVKNESIR